MTIKKYNTRANIASCKEINYTIYLEYSETRGYLTGVYPTRDNLTRGNPTRGNPINN